MDSSNSKDVTSPASMDSQHSTIIHKCWYDARKWVQMMATCRICRSLTVTAFLAVLLIETIILIPSYLNYEEDLLRNRVSIAKQSIETLLIASNANLQQPQLQVLLNTANLLGVRVEAEQQWLSVGEEVISPHDATGLLRNIPGNDTNTLALAWNPGALHPEYKVEAKLDLRGIADQLNDFVMRILGLSLLIATGVTVVIMGVLDRMMLSRLMRLRTRITSAGVDTQNPLHYISLLENHDEFGEVEEALNQMLGHSANNLEKLNALNLKLDKLVVERTQSLRATEQELEITNWYDQLTGLANRSLFEESLRRYFQEPATSNQEGALVMLGIDDFRAINGLEGHNVGDLVLRAIADRLNTFSRDKGLLSRLGGDLFAVLITGKKGHFLNQVSGQVNALVKACQETICIDDNEIVCEMSAGVAIFPADGYDATTLLQHAEIAMLRSKQSEDNAIEYFAEVFGHEVQKRKDLIRDLKNALPNKELQLFYQPQFNSERNCVGYEALIRWNRPTRGTVSPAEFIPLAESTGLIHPIGNWVLEEAIATLKKWSHEGFCGRMAVNLSAHQMKNVELASYVGSLLEQYQVHPSLLELEITESAVMQDVDRALSILNELKVLEIDVAIDDFWTGYSSLAYLKQFPVSRLKIDRAFVMGLPDNEQDIILCQTIIALSHNMGFKVIAEGVETELQAQWLIDNDCDELQGYLLGRPNPAPQYPCSLQT
jgi:diguanylate cyclase (GGDEF)-like protein